MDQGATQALFAEGRERLNAGDFEGALTRLLTVSMVAVAEPAAHYNLGVAYKSLNRLDEAEAAFRRSVELHPTPARKYALAVTLLGLGRYPEGFALYDNRHEVDKLAMEKPGFPFHYWQGESLAGKKLIIWPEQGHGDMIQHARFAPVLKAMGARVELFCTPELGALFKGSLDVEVRPIDGRVEVACDTWIMAASVAGRLGMTPDTLPNAPYLHAPGFWTRPLPEGFKIGLKATGSPAHANNPNRSIPPDAVAALKTLDAQVISLEPEETGAKDFAETAALIEKLDLVISACTSVAHLAGAMGKPCWVLLPAVNTDWRWLRGRSDSPWYPSIRLFRHAPPGDWMKVVDNVHRAFSALRA